MTTRARDIPRWIKLIAPLALAVILSACGFTAGQLADKAREEQLLRPGALDTPLTSYYDTYTYRLLDRYRVVHDWPVSSDCKYGKLRANNKDGGRRYEGALFSAGDIVESDNSTWQRFGNGIKPYRIDRFVRPTYTRRLDLVDAAGNKAPTDKVERGLEPLCFELWVATNHAMTLMLQRRSVDEWQDALKNWVNGAYVSPLATKSTEHVGDNAWTVYRIPAQPKPADSASGPFELRILKLGASGYTLTIELSATQNSLQSQNAHEQLRAMLRHVVQSVKLDALTPAIEAEMAQIKARAEQVQRQECIEQAKRSKPFPWCEKYLKP